MTNSLNVASYRLECDASRPQKLPLVPRLLRWATWTVLSRAIRVHVEGIANIPETGPFILIWNHLHISDAMLLFGMMPRPVTFIATGKFKWKNPLIHVYMKWAGAILIAQGRPDHRAMRQALKALAGGTPVALAPEGRVSPTGALLKAERGVAALVRHSRVPVVPAAIWGQHKAHHSWKRLRRPEVTIRFGAPVAYPQSSSSATDLDRLTTDILITLARELPSQYRGVYAGATTRTEQVSCA